MQNIDQGTYVFEFLSSTEWPPKRNFEIQRIDFDVGTFVATATREGKICLKVIRKIDGLKIEARTPQLNFANTKRTKIAFSWEFPSEWNLALKGLLISNNDQSVPENWTVQAISSGAECDFSAQNELAFRKRRDTLAGWQTPPGRIAATSEEFLSALREEQQQIDDLLDFLRAGSLHHYKGLASRLRLTIADGRPLPLLQACAAIKNRRLLVYDSGHHLSEQFAVGTVKEKSNSQITVPTIELERHEKWPIQIDLDVWLDCRWGKVNQLDLTNRQVLKELGNLVGSHFDPGLKPIVNWMTRATTDSRGIRATLAQIYVGQLGWITSGLIRQVLDSDSVDH